MIVQQNNNNVVCCFCGKSLPLKHAATITVRSNFESDEEQYLFCHKDCLIEKIDKSIPLHPDLTGDEL